MSDNIYNILANFNKVAITPVEPIKTTLTESVKPQRTSMVESLESKYKSFKERLDESYEAYDPGADEDDEYGPDIHNGDYVTDKWESSGEVYRVSQCDGDRCWIGDRDNRGWYIDTSRLNLVNPVTDEYKISQYFDLDADDELEETFESQDDLFEPEEDYRRRTQRDSEFDNEFDDEPNFDDEDDLEEASEHSPMLWDPEQGVDDTGATGYVREIDTDVIDIPTQLAQALRLDSNAIICDLEYEGTGNGIQFNKVTAHAWDEASDTLGNPVDITGPASSNKELHDILWTWVSDHDLDNYEREAASQQDSGDEWADYNIDESHYSSGMTKQEQHSEVKALLASRAKRHEGMHNESSEEVTELKSPTKRSVAKGDKLYNYHKNRMHSQDNDISQHEINTRGIDPDYYNLSSDNDDMDSEEYGATDFRSKQSWDDNTSNFDDPSTWTDDFESDSVLSGYEHPIAYLKWAINQELRKKQNADPEVLAKYKSELATVEDKYQRRVKQLNRSNAPSINEKAVSKSQQKFMGMVHAAQKGEKPASKEVAKVAKGMGKRDVTDFASTKHKGLPKHVTESRLMESEDTFDHILHHYSAEVKKFKKGHELDDRLYDALYDYYSEDMPYGIKKARDGDPYTWVSDKFDEDLGLDNMPDMNVELDEIAQLAGLSRNSSNSIDQHASSDELLPTVDEDEEYFDPNNPTHFDNDDEDECPACSGTGNDPYDAEPCRACSSVDEVIADEGNEFSGALNAAKASGEQEFEVAGKKYTVKEDVTLNVSATGEEDVLNVIRKLSGMAEVNVPHNEPEEEFTDIDEERDIEHVNTPREKIAPISAAYPSGTDMHRSKKSYSGKPYRGDNPMAESKEDSLWTKYSTMLQGLIK